MSYRASRIGRLLMLSVAIAAGLISSSVRGDDTPQAATAVVSAPAPDAKPNIVLILADDLGVETINTYGGEYYTPRIDELARQGLTFSNAYAMPLCTPTRVRLMTGRENAKNYKAFGYLDPKEKTFGNYFKEAGYVTGVVGKWQLTGNGYDGLVGTGPQIAGFDESLLWQEKILDAKGSRYWGPSLSLNGHYKINESGFGPDMQSDFALDFIKRHQGAPFFLYYPMVLTHPPFVPTPDSPTAKDDKTRFAGMVTYMDTLVGKVMDELTELGLDKNTIVIFTGDNGTATQIVSYRNGFQVRGGKGSPSLAGTHVPFIARWPSHFAAGESRTGLFDLMDIYPTLAELVGVPVKAGSMDGVSQVPVLKGEKDRARDWIFMHYAPVWIQSPARFIFDDKFKLYGDGRFMALDPDRGTETPISNPVAGTPAGDRLGEFQKALSAIKDGPLDPNRFPFCTGKPSPDGKRPATEVGCAFIDSGFD